jgi:hypothetical protein
MGNTFRMHVSMSACCHLTPNPLPSQLLFKAVESKLRSSQTTKTIVARFATCRADTIFQQVIKGDTG